MNLLRSLFNVLTPRARRRLPWMLAAFAVTSVFEVLGVAAIFPFMMALSKPALVQTHPVLHRAYEWSGVATSESFLMLLGFTVLGALVFGNAAGFATTWLSLSFIGQERAALSALLLERYLSRRYVWFLGRNSAELGRNVVEEVASIPFGMLLPMLRIFSRGLVVLLILLQLVLMDPTIAIITVLVLGGAYAVVWLYTRNRLNQIGVERLSTEALKYKVSLEALNGIKTTMILGREHTFLERFERASIDAAKLQVAQGLLSESPRFLLETLAFGGVVVVILVLCARGDDVGYVLPVVSVFALSAYRLMPALQQSFAYLASIKANIPALKFLSEDYSGPPGEYRELTPIQPLKFDRDFALVDAQLTYPGSSSPVLNGINLKIARGSSVAFVGPTGSGKTSLVDVLIGLLQLQAGWIEVDGRRLEESDIRGWQANIGYVSQDIYLVDDTVAANIAFGVPVEEIDQERVESSARMANLHDFIVKEMPGGYSSIVGERGVRLSGGQRQRVGIARALYTNPSILVLDEATSALDGVTESIVMEAVTALSSQKTLVIIAHRLSTIRSCDLIYLLEGGQVSAAGNFDELMKSSPKFQAMARAAASETA